jgi:Domain of unknown function (DUF1844)
MVLRSRTSGSAHWTLIFNVTIQRPDATIRSRDYQITRLPDAWLLGLMPELTFIAFVLSLASTAAIHFGDLPDPESGKPLEPNLDGASQIIEILGLLDQKTRGNLTVEERQVLEQVLYELRMRFVQAKSTEKRIVEP